MVYCCSDGERAAAEGVYVLVSVDLAAGVLILDFLQMVIQLPVDFRWDGGVDLDFMLSCISVVSFALLDLRFFMDGAHLTFLVIL